MENDHPIHRIAVLSDTHGLLRPEVVRILASCEVILHGGDIDSPKVLDALREIAPVHAVRGNNDRGWAKDIAHDLTIVLYGLHIYMVHDHKRRKQDLAGTDLFIYGHSHRYEEKEMDGVRALNPGSCGPRRFRLPVTMAVLEIEEDTRAWRIVRIDFAADGEKSPVLDMTGGDLRAAVEKIVREMRAGRRVETIARRLCLDAGFVEQVCRILVTHPGVDVQGIMDRIEVNGIGPARGAAGHGP